MKAKDLMIGDLVLIDCTPRNKYFEPGIIICLGSEDAEIVAKNQDGLPFYTDDEEKVLPMPLTAEIMDKNCGNVKDYRGVSYEWTWYNDDMGYIEVSAHAEGEDCEDGFFISANGGEYYLFVIHYVHELQHALRILGIDKEIEL